MSSPILSNRPVTPPAIDLPRLIRNRIPLAVNPLNLPAAEQFNRLSSICLNRTVSFVESFSDSSINQIFNGPSDENQTPLSACLNANKLKSNHSRSAEYLVSIHSKLGEKFLEEGLYDEAIEHLKKSIAYKLDLYAIHTLPQIKEDPELMKTIHSLREAYLNKGKKLLETEKATALEPLNLSLELGLDYFGKEDATTIISLQLVTSLYQAIAYEDKKEKQHDKAYQGYKKILDLLDLFSPLHHEQFASLLCTTYLDVANFLKDKNMVDEAIETLKLAIFLYNNLDLKTDPIIVCIYNALASFYYYKKKDLKNGDFYWKALLNLPLPQQAEKLVDAYRWLGQVIHEEAVEANDKNNFSVAIRKFLLCRGIYVKLNTNNNLKSEQDVYNLKNVDQWIGDAYFLWAKEVQATDLKLAVNLYEKAIPYCLTGFGPFASGTEKCLEALRNAYIQLLIQPSAQILPPAA